MSVLTLEPVSDGFTLRVSGDLPPLSSDGQAHTDSVWAALKLRREDALYDDPLLLLEHYDSEGMKGCWSNYRRYVTARDEPDRIGRVTPIGVTGVLVCGDLVVVGERAGSVTSYPGYFELAPSGGVDRNFFDPATGRVDYVEQLLGELEEEVGLDRSVVVRIETLGVVRELDDPCCDICVRLDLGIDRAALDQALGGTVQPEYARLFSVDRTGLRTFANRHQELLPTSAAILRHLGWIKAG